MSRLDIDSMRALTAIADTGGITRAANKLNLSQSAVSHKIKRLEERLLVIDVHVSVWAAAETIEEAKAAAEAAANHVVGPDGPGYGDRDGDGEVRGPRDAGILPGVDGTPAGFALEAFESLPADDPVAVCLEETVLGGSWDDPAGRWALMEEAIAEWTPSFNTMPGLPSHPQRVVGWATFTIESDSLAEAHEYAGHAGLHVGASQRAIDC